MEEKLQNIQQEEDINYVEYASKLWKKRKTLIVWTIAGLVFGVFMAIITPKTYNVETILAWETDSRMGGGNVSSLASMMGISIDNSSDAINPNLFPYVMSSTPFVFEVLDTPVRTKKGIETDYLNYVLNYKKIPWWQTVMSIPAKSTSVVKSLFSKKTGKKWKKGDHIEVDSLSIEALPGVVRRVIRSFSDVVTYTADKKTGKISLLVQEQDPLVAKTVTDEIVANLTDYMTSYRTSKARQDVEMLTKICDERKAEYYAAQKAYAKYMDSNKNIILQSAQAEREHLQQEMNLAYQIYSQVATQLETARIKEQTSKPVFAVIEPAKVPTKNSAPDVMKFAIVFAFLFFAFTSAYILFWDLAKEKFEEIKNN